MADRLEPQDTQHPDSDDLDPARGVLTGVLLGLGLWVLLIATCFAVRKG
jgi:hypothetical protein